MIDQQTLEQQERQISRALSAWAATSVTVGAVAALVGRASGRRELTRFGRQTALWGVVDGAIAAAGVISRRRRGDLTDEEATAQARRLRKLLAINAAADVAYVGLGAAVVRRASRGRTTLRLGRGDGVAIVIQGAFLLALDSHHAYHLKI